jgi:hypothetical protein
MTEACLRTNVAAAYHSTCFSVYFQLPRVFRVRGCVVQSSLSLFRFVQDSLVVMPLRSLRCLRPPSKAPNCNLQKSKCTYHQQVRILKPLSRCLSGGLKSRCAAAVNSASFGYVSSARPLVCNPSNAVGEPCRARLTAWFKYVNSRPCKYQMYQWLLHT